MHNQVAPDLGKIGVMVALESAGKNAEELANLARMLAMHVAATNPVALDLEGVPAETLEREKAILADKNKGKPPQVLEKILAGGLKSYAKENCLLDQAYVHDPSKSVTQALKEAEGKVGGPVKITGFVRYALGEGIEKKEDDFAAEVAAAAAATLAVMIEKFAIARSQARANFAIGTLGESRPHALGRTAGRHRSSGAALKASEEAAAMAAGGATGKAAAKGGKRRQARLQAAAFEAVGRGPHGPERLRDRCLRRRPAGSRHLRGDAPAATRSPLWWAAATSSAGSRAPPRAWTAPPPTTWACSRP